MSAAKHATASYAADYASAKGLALDSAELAAALDAADALREHRDAFHFPKQADGTTPQRYFAGNSLGLQHKGVADKVQSMLTKWQNEAVEGWWTGGEESSWFHIDDSLRADMASLVGASTEEVALMNSLTVNLHFLMAAFYKPSGKRTKILCEQFPFPSDMHAFVSQAEFHGLSPDDVVSIGSNETPAVISTQTFLDAIEAHKDTAAIIVVAAVQFLSGQFFDIGAISAAARKHGIVVAVDAAHAVGNVPLKLHEWNVDFATWCTYKYLNSGPGNLGGCFVHSRHCGGEQPAMRSQLKGWWGHARKNRFSLHKTFDQMDGANAFQISTVNVIGMTTLTPSMRLAASIGINNLRDKSVGLTGYLELLLRTYLSHAYPIITPADPAQRGAQISVRILPGALRDGMVETKDGTQETLADAAQRVLLAAGVVVDSRPPDVLRIAPVPTYNSFEDVWALFGVLRKLARDSA